MSLLLCLTLNSLLSFHATAQQAKVSPKLALSGIDYLGRKIDLRDYAGKTVLISFYSGGCTVCARDLKLMREFFRDNAAKNFVLIGINIDKTKADFEMYAKIVAASVPKNQQFPLIWRGSTETLEGFGNISSDPSHFVISANGQISLKREGTFKSEDWDNLWEVLHP
ncbi:peroxiredoxin family protein [Undibacterium sp. Di24W]|uniref:peroxiredoxin family protein n=1 Tax=Undibacterium sp. Di24W TaxID=3413033 RepID=UPI003BF2FED1